MLLSARLKRFFKDLGISVKVRTVTGKHPFVQVWIPYGSEQVFPNFIRECAVLSNYGIDSLDKCNILNREDIHYGNTQPRSLSISESEGSRFFELLENN